MLSIEKAVSLKAEYLSELILQVLKENSISFEHILSQCYDGAAVMSGHKNGIQTLIQQKLNRSIPYVYCVNHQLHLIIITLVSGISEVQQFFDYCKLIHKIFSTFKFKTFYAGNTTTQLLEQR